MPQNRYLPEGIEINRPRNRAYLLSAEGLRRAAADNAILEARAVLCDAGKNLIVELGPMKGIIPREEAAVGICDGKTREIAVISRVGRPVCFKVISTEDERYRPYALLSRRAAQKEAADFFLNEVPCGEVIRAKVTHLEPFGAFCDIGCGIVSLIGIENISVSRIAHPSERFYPGQEILAAVLSKDREKGRISLTHRELLGTWEQNVTRFKAGETVGGIVRSVEEYGIFVEILPNLSGLAEKKEGVKSGDRVSVYIKSIIPERMKIKLIIIDTIEKVPERTCLEYHIREGRIKEWVYTPEGYKHKVIKTEFPEG